MVQPPPPRHPHLMLALALASLAAAGPAAAQLLGGVGLPGLPGVSTPQSDLPGALRDTLPVQTPDLRGAVGGVGDLAAGPLNDLRRLRARALLRDNRRALEADGRGEPVVRGEVLAISPSPEALAMARQAGFSVRDENRLDELDLRLVTLTAPPGVSAVAAVARLRALDPQGQYDFNHLYQPSGELRRGPPAAVGQPPPDLAGPSVRVGLIDGGVSDRQATLSGGVLVQAGFAGPPKPTPHATAVASLLAGRQGVFRGAAPGARLYVADIYGGLPTGGSAAALARALAWMAQNRVPVVNVSLVGPANLTVEAAILAMTARGYLVVAPVGNDGPAAPALYPASYPGVIAVTAVDGRKRRLPEAGRGTHVDFAAPGADMAAAALDGGFVSVRGTSFAAPLAAGRLARLITTPDRAAAARALDVLGREAADLGPPGPDRTFGRGLVAFDLRTDPAKVAARGPVMRRP